MSLAVAIWTATDAYTLAADSRVSVGGGAGINLSTSDKGFTVGRWFVGMAGGVPAAWRYRRHLLAFAEKGKAATLTTRAAVEDLVDALHDVVIEACGGNEPGEYPETGATLLMVGPVGICIVSGTGDVHWFSAPGTSYAAIGCAEDYAIGRLDHVASERAVTCEDAAPTILAACDRYGGVGPPVVTFDSADIVEPVARPKRSRTKTGPAAQTAGDGAPVPRPRRKRPGVMA